MRSGWSPSVRSKSEKIGAAGIEELFGSLCDPTQYMDKLKVIAISGSGRSGSTLLSLLLSQDNSVFNLGQMRHLWQVPTRT